MNIKFTTFTRLESKPISVLELSERASNCLSRAKIHTIGELIDRINTLRDINGCGSKVEREVKSALFWYELFAAKDTQRFLDKVKIGE